MCVKEILDKSNEGEVMFIRGKTVGITEPSVAKFNRLKVASALFADETGRIDLDLWEDHISAVQFGQVYSVGPACPSATVVGQEEGLNDGAHNHHSRRNGRIFIKNSSDVRRRIERRVCFKYFDDPKFSVCREGGDVSSVHVVLQKNSASNGFLSCTM